jgi:hypothetical protein
LIQHCDWLRKIKGKKIEDLPKVEEMDAEQVTQSKLLQREFNMAATAATVVFTDKTTEPKTTEPGLADKTADKTLVPDKTTDKTTESGAEDSKLSGEDSTDVDADVDSDEGQLVGFGDGSFPPSPAGSINLDDEFAKQVIQNL